MKSTDCKFGIHTGRVTAYPPKILSHPARQPPKEVRAALVLARELSWDFRGCTHEHAGLVTMNMPRRHIAHGCDDMVALPSKPLDNNRVGTKTMSAVAAQEFNNTGS